MSQQQIVTKATIHFLQLNGLSVPTQLIESNWFLRQREKVDEVKQTNLFGDTRIGSQARTNRTSDHCICGNAKCKVLQNLLAAKSAKSGIRTR